MTKFFIFLALIMCFTSLPSFASIKEAPPSFRYKNDRAVYVDFKEAVYKITYDFSAKKVLVESTINFFSPKDGYPVFDLIAQPFDVYLEGAKTVTHVVADPDGQSNFRVVQRKISRGHYQLKLKHYIDTNVVFNEGGLASAFWMSDLTDRKYLEQYLPTNLEFDQYKMHMKVRVLGCEGKEHLLKSNGKVTKISENSFEVTYPSFYSTSSVYFHLFPKINSATNVQFYYRSLDGRLIPVDIYTTYNIQDFVNATKSILGELESDYGPFPHNQLIIYGNAPSGGMEYSGATATSLRALGHELFHSYHARGLMPANGNAGWMDEAIARWRDNNYPLTAKLNFSSAKLGGHSLWSRKTDRMAYTEGSAFLSWIAYKMNERDLSFKTFLKDYFTKYKYKTVTTGIFQSELTKASELDLKEDFDRYIYGKIPTHTPSIKHFEEDPNHPKYTKEQLLNLTWL